MADVTFTCPYCEQKIEAPEEMADSKSECPSCQCEIQIPKASQPEMAAPPPVLVSQPPPFISSPGTEFTGGHQPHSKTHFIAAKCPSCGGDLQVPDNRDQVKCMYCGVTVITRQAVQLAAAGVNLENLMELARAASDAGNPKEAYDYYTKVLEHNPRNAAAWAGKGESAGWMSTINNIKTTEMIAGLNNAINCAADTDKPAMREHCANVVISVTSACFTIAKDHLREFAGLNGTWEQYLNQCTSLVSALEVGYAYNPNNATAIENIILICVDNIQGISFTNFDNLPSSLFVSEQYEALLRTKVDRFSEIMKRLDPSFIKPKIQKVASSAGWDLLRAWNG